VARVTATVDTAVANYGATDEFGEGILVFENGVVGTLAAGWVDVQNPVTALVSGTEGHAYVCEDKLYFKSSHVEGADGKTPWTRSAGSLAARLRVVPRRRQRRGDGEPRHPARSRRAQRGDGGDVRGGRGAHAWVAVA
jgi:hypothetical protein